MLATGPTLMPAMMSRGAACCPVPSSLDGVRPSSDVITRLRAGLAAEVRAVGDLRSARCVIREAVTVARAGGSGYFEIATAIVPATGDVQETMKKRERVAGNLRARMFEARACRK